MVEGIDNEGTDKTGREEDDRVDETDKPLVAPYTVDAEGSGE